MDLSILSLTNTKFALRKKLLIVHCVVLSACMLDKMITHIITLGNAMMGEETHWSIKPNCTVTCWYLCFVQCIRCCNCIHK